MDVFIRNISYHATDRDVKNALSSIIHRPPFPSEPLNFHVRLLNRKRSKGCAILTFPEESHARTFLELFANGLVCKQRRMQFSPSKYPSDSARVSWLRDHPWRSPQELEDARVQQEEQSQSIPLHSFAFGRLCRDMHFSPEDVHTGDVEVSCNQMQRRFCVTQTSEAPGVKNVTMAWYRAAQIRAVVVLPESQDQHYVVVETTSHPIIQRSSSPLANEGASSIGDILRAAFEDLFSDEITRQPPAQRLSSWLGDGEMLPIGRFVRLEFRSRNELYRFIGRCKSIYQRRVLIHTIIFDSKYLYSSDLVSWARDFMAHRLPFEVAFALDQALASGILDYREAQELEQHLIGLVNEHGAEAGPIVRLFLLVLSSSLPSLLNLEDDPSHLNFKRPTRRSRRRRRGRNRIMDAPPPPEPSLPSLPQLLKEAVTEHLAQKVEASKPRLLSLAFRAAVYQSYRLILAPTSRVLEGPLPDMSSDILRHFGHHECFLRVLIQDENKVLLRGDHPILDIKELLENRYKKALVEGVTVAGRHYEFLGYSMSALREHSVVFVHPFKDEEGNLITAEAIRNRLGDFSKISRYPALLGARWAQAFSASEPSISIEPHEINYNLADIERTIPGTSRTSCFTDGVGRISTDLLTDVLKAAAQKMYSVIQIRFGGVKGVVTHDPTLKGREIGLRPSQTKFSSPSNTLNIAGYSRPIKTFLNRPLIMLLEHGGVDTDVFVELQQAAVDDVNRIRASFTHAAMLFNQHGLGSSFQMPSLLNNLVHQLHIRDGTVGSLDCKIIQRCMEFAITHVLREIRFRAHIPVPGSYTLIGVADEWDCLEEGEVYVRIVDEKNNVAKTLSGKVLVTRSPQIHPGDLQFAEAVEREPLKHLENVIVFSCRGDRCLPSCLGGGDLDGDIYNIIDNPRLFPTKIAEPGSYTPLGRKELEKPCTVEDVAGFVIDYLQTDLLGYISILHLRIADMHGADSAECMLLAEYASHAVDFPKTGTPVDFSKLPRAPSNLKPDFLAQELIDPTNADSGYYPSQKILGKLFRNIHLDDQGGIEDPVHSFGDVIWKELKKLEPEFARYGLTSNTFWVGDQMTEDEWALNEEMDGILGEYTNELTRIAKAHTLSKREGDQLTEAELVSGTIQAKWADHRKRREAIAAMNLQTQILTQAMRKELRRLPPDAGTDDDGYEREDEDDEFEEDQLSARDVSAFRRAIGAWNVALYALDEDPYLFGPSSFALIALGMILKIWKKTKETSKKGQFFRV